ncbi:MAG: hydantoinase/oxoprolinase family protein [Candidatus Eiseniibacteriota bacterium]
MRRGVRGRRRGGIHVGIDTGGTFTDFLVVHPGPGGSFLFKVPSTPDDPSRAFHQGLAIAARRLLALGVDVARSRPWEVAHGFTVATNALLARRGARIALVTTAGFEDFLEIARQDRPELYALAPRRPPSLVPAGAALGLDERTGPGGEALVPLRPAALAAVVRRARRLRPEAVAVCLLHSYANPSNERRVGRALARAFPGVPVSLSSDVVRMYREVERGSTTTVNAYVGPLVQRYLARLDAPRAHRLRIMQSNGGVARAREAARTPVHTVLSGPAGGVLGAHRIARAAGLSTILTLDIGGTSTDVALVPGRLLATRESEIGGVPLAIPILDVHTVGAGGGSIARVDAGGALAVGPSSAGADPGPACYGRGGPATVTDAQVVLGRILPGLFLDGAMPLDVAAATRALARLGRTLGTDVITAARGVLGVANATIERALRVISVERGHDVRDAALVAFGGAGPLHACELAESLGVGEVLVPPGAGVLSAWGLLGADEMHDVTRTILLSVAPSERWPAPRVRETFASLRREITGRLVGAGAGWAFETACALRYRGQSFELLVPAGSLAQAGRDLRNEFHRAHERRFGYARPGESIEIVQCELTARRRGPSLPVQRAPARTRARDARLGSTPVFARAGSGRPQRVPVLRREALGRDLAARGPLVIVEYGATTWVPAGWRVRMDTLGHLRLTWGRRS